MCRVDEMKADLLKPAFILSVVCNNKVPLKLIGKCYRKAIKTAMIRLWYGLKCWEVKNQQQNKFNIANMRMF